MGIRCAVSLGMPPKRRSSGASSAAASSSVASPPSKPPKNLKATVKKAIYDNFKGWADEDIYIKKNSEGLTLEEQLTRDLADPSMTCGGGYYKLLKEARRPGSDPLSCLKVPESGLEPVRPQFLQAIIGLKKKRKDFALICACLESDGNPNKTEFVGVHRSVLVLNPELDNHRLTCQALLAWVARLNLPSRWAVECELCRPFYDHTLVCMRTPWRHRLPP